MAAICLAWAISASLSGPRAPRIADQQDDGYEDARHQQHDDRAPPAQPGELDDQQAHHRAILRRRRDAHPVVGGELEEDRLEVGPDRGELGEVEAGLGEDPGDSFAGLVGRRRRATAPSCRTVMPGASSAAPAADRVAHAESVGRAAEEVLDRPGHQHPAVADDGRARAHLLHLGQDVRAQQHRHPGLAEVADQLADLADAGRVEAVGRLVEDQQLG